MDTNNKERDNKEQSGEITLRRILDFVIGNIFWFILSLVVCLAAGYAYCKIAKRSYQSTAMIYVDEEYSRGIKSDVSPMSQIRMVRRTSVVDNEVSFLKSRTLITRVVDQLDANVSYFEYQRLRKVEIYSADSPVILHVDTLINPFTADFALLEDILIFTVNYSVNGKKQHVEINDMYGQLIDIPQVGRLVVERNRSVENMPNKFSVKVGRVDAVAADYRKAIQIAPLSKTTSVIGITLTDAVAQKAADIVNRLVDVYNEDAREGSRETAQATMDFIEERLLVVGSDLESVDSQVEEFKRDNQSVDLASEATLYLEAGKQLEEKAVETGSQIAVLESMQAYLNATAAIRLVPSLSIDDGALTQSIAEYNRLPSTTVWFRSTSLWVAMRLTAT